MLGELMITVHNYYSLKSIHDLCGLYCLFICQIHLWCMSTLKNELNLRHNGT